MGVSHAVGVACLNKYIYSGNIQWQGTFDFDYVTLATPPWHALTEETSADIQAQERFVAWKPLYFYNMYLGPPHSNSN